MITISHKYLHTNNWNIKQDCAIGNILFRIAGTIGIAIKNGFDYGFHEWENQKYFINELPKIVVTTLPIINVPQNYKGYDIGYQEFDIQDNTEIFGYMGSPKYFDHCESIIKYYFKMKPLCKVYKDTILIHYRNYQNPAFYSLTTYYTEALKLLPEKRIVVVTDNIEAARNAIGIDCEYISNSPIEDLYLLTQADYLILSNSTFSWWGAWLSNAQIIIAPNHWFSGEFSDAPFDLTDFYLDSWKKIK